MLGMEKQLITTNKDIKNYDFYNKNNISIFERTHSSFDVAQLDREYNTLNDEIYYKYSLENWIYDVLGGIQHEKQIFFFGINKKYI